MSQPSVMRVVDAIVRARKKKATNGQILDRLVKLGIRPLEAPSVLEWVDNGFKAGAVLPSEHLATEFTHEGNPFYDLAFKRGIASRSATTPTWGLLGFMVMVLILGLLVGITLWNG
jgi:hypothetical protein